MQTEQLIFFQSFLDFFSFKSDKLCEQVNNGYGVALQCLEATLRLHRVITYTIDSRRYHSLITSLSQCYHVVITCDKHVITP